MSEAAAHKTKFTFHKLPSRNRKMSDQIKNLYGKFWRVFSSGNVQQTKRTRKVTYRKIELCLKAKIIFLPSLWDSRSAVELPSPILRTLFMFSFICTYIASRTPVGCPACTLCLLREHKTHARLLLPWKAFLSLSLSLDISVRRGT